MILLLSEPLRYLEVLSLVFIRIAGIFIVAPFLSSRNIPVVSKLILAFFLSLITFNLYDFSNIPESANAINYALAVTKEIFVGWIIGFGAYFVYSLLTLTGQFIDQQIGFSMVNVFDPLSQVQLSITGTFYYYLVLTLLILSNAHHFLIRAVIKSFELIPIGRVTLSPLLNQTVIAFMNEFFVIALQISAPVFFIILMTDSILGILARTAPQMNLFVIGFPIKILLGLLVLLVTLNVFKTVSTLIDDNTKSLVENIIKGLMP